MAEITRILAANIRRQFFFVITTTTSTLCLVQISAHFLFASSECHITIRRQWNFKFFKWPNDRMIAVVKHCWLFVGGRRGSRER